MSAVLRASGADFDVDAFLPSCALHVCAIYRRGEPVFPASQPDGRKRERSGLNVSVGDADLEALPPQVEAAIGFLQAHCEQVRRLCEFPGVKDVTLDFGIHRRDVMAQYDHLPAELVRLAGALGLGIELSQYLVEEDEE